MSVYERDPTTGDLNLVSGMRSLDDCKTLMLELCYPVGSVYTSTNNVSPQTFLGGTWISLDGYMLRGATSGVTKNQNQNDGGADSVTVSSVASHNHTQDSHNHDQNSHNHTQDQHRHSFTHRNSNYTYSYAAGGTTGTPDWNNNSNTGYTTATNQAKTATNQAKTATNQAKGATYSLTTLPKYKNVYIWERTA